MTMPTLPVLRARNDGRWELAERYYEVPAGFCTDGASIPRFLWRVCGHPMETPRIAAAVVHDWHYSQGDISRAEADSLFRELLVAAGECRFRAWIYWMAVRIFGARHYNNNNNNNKRR